MHVIETQLLQIQMVNVVSTGPNTMDTYTIDTNAMENRYTNNRDTLRSVAIPIKY